MSRKRVCLLVGSFFLTITVFLLSVSPVEAACTKSPDTVTSLSPGNGATLTTITPKLTWNKPKSWGTKCSAADGYYTVSIWNPLTGEYLISEINTGSTTIKGVLVPNAYFNVPPCLGFIYNNTQYNWRVRAWNKAGNSSKADTSFRTPATCTPGAPTAFNLSLPANNATGVSTAPTLSWQATACFNSCSATGYYKAYLGPNPGQPTFQGGGAATSFSLSGLASGTSYSWKVAACHDATSPPSCTDSTSIFSFTTCPAVVPTAPGLLNPQGPNQPTTQLNLTWTAPNWNDCNSGENRYYKVFLNKASSPKIWLDTVAGTQTSFQVSGLEKDTDYVWTLQACNGTGCSLEATALSFKTSTTATSCPACDASDPTCFAY